MRFTMSNPIKLERIRAIMDFGSHSQTKGSLIVNVHAVVWQVRQGDDVDVIRRFGRLGGDSRGFHQANESFAIAVDVLINPVPDGYFGPGIRKSGVYNGDSPDRSGRNGSRQKKSSSGLHVEL